MLTSSQSLRRAGPAVAALAAAAVTAISFTHGGYFPREWGWALLAFVLACLLAVLVRDRLVLGPIELVALGLLAGFAGWTALSTIWSVSAAQPLLATERTLVYVAALAACLLVAQRARDAESIVGGVVAAAAVVCGYALCARLFPGTLTTYPPANGYQLQDPIGYWNGLAILAAIGALGAACTVAEAGARVLRTLAAAVLPVLVTALYFTFSRGGALALLAGACVALAVTRRRLHLLAVFGLLAPLVALAVWYSSRFPALTRAGATLAAARSAGWRVGLVVCCCSAAAAGTAWLLPTLERRVQVGARAQRLVGAVLAGVVLLASAAVLVHAGGPSGIAARVSDSFNRSLPNTGGDLNRRLTSFSSDGRADYWRVAWREVTAHPVLGGGAGSYERYWHRYRPTAYEALNAHNLYLETLAELGPFGLALLVAAFCVPFVAAIRSRGRPGVTAAAAGLSAYLAHAALDWDFQIVAVTLAGLLCAAALLVAARNESPGRLLTTRVRAGALVVCAALVAVAIAIQAGNSALADGQAALDRGDTTTALRLADRAHTWQPWSYEPLQLAGEAELARGRTAQARRAFQRALARDRSAWSLWLDVADSSRGSARLDALARARRLNPREPELAATPKVKPR